MLRTNQECLNPLKAGQHSDLRNYQKVLKRVMSGLNPLKAGQHSDFGKYPSYDGISMVYVLIP